MIWYAVSCFIHLHYKANIWFDGKGKALLQEGKVWPKSCKDNDNNDIKMTVCEMIRRLTTAILLLAGKLLLCSFGGGSNQWQSQLCTVSSARDIDNSCSAVIMFTNTVRVLDSLLPPLHQSYGQFPIRVLDQWTRCEGRGCTQHHTMVHHLTLYKVRIILSWGGEDWTGHWTGWYF